LGIVTHVCAWCSRALSSVDGSNDSERVTHGICEDCVEAIISGMGRDLQQFLETIDAPVITIDAEGVVGSANQKATELLGRSLPSMEGQMVGTVTDCAYARLPGGCGKTKSCTACTLRDVIDRTVETGRGLSDVPVNQTVLTGDGTETVTYRISSEKVGDVVFLKIREGTTPQEAPDGG
jgi:hypothetical protein